MAEEKTCKRSAEQQAKPEARYNRRIKTPVSPPAPLQLLMRTGGRYSMVQVREACAKLADNGRVYSTLDENHFKTCE
jgi:hypothetical protein